MLFFLILIEIVSTIMRRNITFLIYVKILISFSVKDNRSYSLYARGVWTTLSVLKIIQGH